MRTLLWLPSAVVSIVFLFAPETAGIATHLMKGGTVVLGKYSIKTPFTSIIGSDHETYLWTFAAPGIARLGFKKYWRHEVPVSEMTFYPVPNPHEQLSKNVPLDGVTIVGTRSIQFGKQSLTCWDLIHHNKFVGSLPADPAIADVACTTDNDDFYSHFSGWRGDAPSFYETLQRITFTD